MQIHTSFTPLPIIGIDRGGKRRYDPQAKRALIQACLEPGISLAGLALAHGVNANLLRKWVVSYQLASDAAAPAVAMADPADAFVPVVLTGSSATQIEKPMCPAPDAVTIPPSRLRAQLPNGVTLEFDCTGRDAVLVSTVIETLGRCDVPSRR